LVLMKIRIDIVALLFLVMLAFASCSKMDMLEPGEDGCGLQIDLRDDALDTFDGGEEFDGAIDTGDDLDDDGDTITDDEDDDDDDDDGTVRNVNG
jgi:hypothetical protein